MGTDTQPVFLFGAGFNADAKAEAGINPQPISINGHIIKAAYPLVGDLFRVCFDLDCTLPERSIEDLFHESKESRNPEPLSRLARILMYSDYGLAPQLIRAKQNCYSKFFDRFAQSQFLTFNYDSLPELFLLRHGRWYPHDGYGLPVAANTLFKHTHLLNQRSKSLVLHLHGSLCLYASEFTFERHSGDDIARLNRRERPKFVFDPDAIGNLFRPFQREHPVFPYERPESRIIAPVPDKTEGLTKELIRAVYKLAGELLRSSAAPLVVIGYSFNPHDRASYEPLLNAVQSGSASVLLISPDAAKIKARISVEFPRVNFQVITRTFRSWVMAAFPGL